MRQVHENENLDGQTLTGEARESLFINCNIDKTIFIGDWRGTDYLGCTGAADWTQADTYASYWRGCDLSGAQFPTDIGFLHHEPVIEILTQRLSVAPSNIRDKFRQIRDFAKADYSNSWDTSTHIWWDALSRNQRQRIVQAALTMFSPYPGLLVRFSKLIRTVENNDPKWSPPADVLRQTLSWPDGTTLDLNVGDMPLGIRSRWDYRQWILAQVGKHAFVYTIFPINVHIYQEEDGWIIRDRLQGH